MSGPFLTPWDDEPLEADERKTNGHDEAGGDTNGHYGDESPGGAHRADDPGAGAATQPPQLHVYRGTGAVTRRRKARRVATAVTLTAVAAAYPAYRWLTQEQVTAPLEVDPGSLVEGMVNAGSSLALPLVPLAGFEQEAQAGSLVELPIRATDALGAALPDTVLRLRVSEGAAVLETAEVRTDSAGIGVARLRLADQLGPNVVMAQIVGSSADEIRIDVTAGPGPPAALESVQGDGQAGAAGELLPQPVGVRVTDASGNPTPGVEVFFQILSGEGRAAPSRIRTDSLGRATARWRLGAGGSQQRLSALVPTAGDAVVTFTANAQGSVTPTEPVAPPASAVTPPPTQAPEAAPTETPEADSGPVTVVRRAYAMGGTTVCRLTGGRVRCRGANDRGQAGTGASGGFVSIATGVAHACALDDDGAAYCWGANAGGQLGDGTRADRAGSGPVTTSLRFSALAAGLSHTCALSPSGVACWGLNVNGQLGDGTRDDRLTPRRVAGDPVYVDLVAGWNHTCGLNAAGALFCWGLNDHGQLGEGSQLDRVIPTRVGGGFREVAAGSAHTCGISGNSVICWGDNSSGQLGDGTLQDRPRPIPVQGLPGRPTAVAAGAVHTCALVEGGEAYCWGQNLHGQLGDGTTRNRSLPGAVAGGLTFTRLWAAGGATCGSASDGNEYCWGFNQSGQLGDGSRTNRSTPTRVGE